MDDETCVTKLNARRLANLELGRYNRPLSHYGTADRARLDTLSRLYRALDRELTEHVLARGEVRVDGLVLVPTRDRLDFVVLDAATMRPRGHIPSDLGNVGRVYLTPGTPAPHPNGGNDADFDAQIQ